jgi:hypothetical protein
MDELIEPIAAANPAARRRTASGEEAGIGELRPKRARITGVNVDRRHRRAAQRPGSLLTAPPWWVRERAKLTAPGLPRWPVPRPILGVPALAERPNAKARNVR